MWEFEARNKSCSYIFCFIVQEMELLTFFKECRNWYEISALNREEKQQKYMTHNKFWKVGFSGSMFKFSIGLVHSCARPLGYIVHNQNLFSSFGESVTQT